MMYANLRDPNGQVLGTVAVDPTKPGGMRGALGDAVQKLQAQGHNLPMAPRPPQPSILPPGAHQSQPYSQSRPFLVELRYRTRLADGRVTWAAQTITAPPGVPPGVYYLAPGR
jgi:hypothetical protein